MVKKAKASGAAKAAGAATAVTTKNPTSSRKRVRDAGSGAFTFKMHSSKLAAEQKMPRIHAALMESIARELSVRDPSGTRLLAATDLDQAAAMAAATILDSTALWVEHLGAFYDTEGVQTLLGGPDNPVSRQAVHKRKGLLALTTGNGRTVYPAFQFRDRTPIAGLGDVLDALPENLVSRWTLASWLVSPEAELDRDRPIDVLADGGDGGRRLVVEAARRWAAQLAA